MWNQEISSRLLIKMLILVWRSLPRPSHPLLATVAARGACVPHCTGGLCHLFIYVLVVNPCLAGSITEPTMMAAHTSAEICLSCTFWNLWYVLGFFYPRSKEMVLELKLANTERCLVVLTCMSNQHVWLFKLTSNSFNGICFKLI